MKVDVHHPDISLTVEVRNKIYIYSEIIPGPGGMPVGTNGSAMLLLSGGIDSPVAGYMVAKRGVKIDAVYFHAPPYTSDRADVYKRQEQQGPQERRVQQGRCRWWRWGRLSLGSRVRLLR